jgi:hypothetical protein
VGVPDFITHLYNARDFIVAVRNFKVQSLSFCVRCDIEPRHVTFAARVRGYLERGYPDDAHHAHKRLPEAQEMSVVGSKVKL